MRNAEALEGLKILLKGLHQLASVSKTVDVEWVKEEEDGSLSVTFQLEPDQGVNIHDRFDELVRGQPRKSTV